MTFENKQQQSGPFGRRLYDQMQGLVRGVGVPTQLITIPSGDDGATEHHVRSVLDLCLRSGEAMLATGASAADVVATLLRISDAYGVVGMHVDITFTSITLSVHRGITEGPNSVMRIVRVRTTDYTRLQNVYRLINDDITGPDGQEAVLVYGDGGIRCSER